MSMSQEEIEALMNESMDLAPAVEETPAEEEVSEEVADEVSMSTEDIAALIEEADVGEVVAEPEEDNIEDLLAGIDGITDDTTSEEVAVDTSSDIDDILAGIDGVTDDEPSVSIEPEVAPQQDVADIMSAQIDQGIYPMPVEKEHKVVNQLNEVAEDSEEKATKIFDVLSFILDENAEIQKDTKKMGEFVEKQTALLEALSAKFPSVAVISENLALAKDLSSTSSVISSKIDEENNQIFNAMDLMQFHDINRQKIERVMSVIRKLSTYLNGIFQDDSDKPEVQIAKHISGDGTDTVSEDDLDSLIAEFSS